MGHLDKLKNVFGDDFTNFNQKRSSIAEINIEQYFVMKKRTIIAHFPTSEDTQTCYQLLSRKFNQIDRKELHVKVTMSYPDAVPTESFTYLEETRKQQIWKMQQEQEQLKKFEWLKAKIKEYHGNFVILSGDNLFVNGLIAIEKEKAKVRNGIEKLHQYKQNWKRLLALAKKRVIPEEMEDLQARIELLQEKEDQAREAQLEDFLKQFEEMEKDFSKFLRRITPPLQSLSAFLKEITLYDYYFEEFFDYKGWKRKFDNVLQFAEQLKLADKRRVIKDHLTTLQNMNQQMEDIGMKLDEAAEQVKEFLRLYRKIPFERLKQKLHLSNGDLKNLLEMLITCGNIRAHIEGTYLYRE